MRQASLVGQVVVEKRRHFKTIEWWRGVAIPRREMLRNLIILLTFEKIDIYYVGTKYLPKWVPVRK